MWISFLRFKFFAFAPTRQSHVHIQRSLFTFMYKRVSEWEIIQNKIQKCVINDALTLAWLHMLQFFGCWTELKCVELTSKDAKLDVRLHEWWCVGTRMRHYRSLLIQLFFLLLLFTAFSADFGVDFLCLCFCCKTSLRFLCFCIKLSVAARNWSPIWHFHVHRNFFASLSCLLALLWLKLHEFTHSRIPDCAFDYCYIG